MLTIRKFNQSDEHYSAAVAIWNANWPDRPATVADWRHTDAERNPDLAFARYVVENAGWINLTKHL